MARQAKKKAKKDKNPLKAAAERVFKTRGMKRQFDPKTHKTKVK